MLVLRAFARIHIRDVQDRFLIRIEHFQDVVSIRARIEEIADIERFQVFVAVQLLVVGVGDGIELGLVLRHQDRNSIPAKIAAGHGHDMHAVTGDEFIELRAKDTVFARRYMVRFVHGNQSIVKRLDPKFFHGEAEGGVGTNKNLIVALKECPN